MNLLAIWKLSRPLNCLITGLSIGVAAVIAGPIITPAPVILASISAMLIAAAANTINDVYDIEIDRINKPQRPLPSGQISHQTARNAATIEYIAGCLFATLISPSVLLIALFVSALTWLYAAKLKQKTLIGNFVVSLSTAAAFIYGALSNGYFYEGIIPAIIAFLFHFAREIIKDLEDVRGDSAVGAQTLPLQYGHRIAVYLTRFILFLVVAVTLYPWMIGYYGNAYGVIVLIGVYPILAYTGLTLNQHISEKKLGFLSKLLKADMLVGLIALLLR